MTLSSPNGIEPPDQWSVFTSHSSLATRHYESLATRHSSIKNGSERSQISFIISRVSIMVYMANQQLSQGRTKPIADGCRRRVAEVERTRVQAEAGSDRRVGDPKIEP